MVRCRNWELQQVCPWGGISAGGDLAETQGFGERSRASLELTECCSKGCSSITRAAERAWAAPGSVCLAQPQTPLLLPSPSFPHVHGDDTGTQQNDGAGGCQVSSFPKSMGWVEVFWKILPDKGFYPAWKLFGSKRQFPSSVPSAVDELLIQLGVCCALPTPLNDGSCRRLQQFILFNFLHKGVLSSLIKRVELDHF